MNRMAFVAAAALVVAMLCPASWGQSARRLTGNVREGVEGHNDALNQEMNNEMNGVNPNQARQQQQPAPPADGLKSGWLTKKTRDGKEVRLYYAYPASLSKAKRAPGLLVIQEWWGVNDDIQERTRDFASKGFYAVAPDLYYGKATDDPAEAAKLRQAMTDAAALTAMKTGLDLLQEEVRNGVVDAMHTGVIGWCMGGQEALLLAIDDPRVKATAIFYGPLVTDAEKLKKLQGPVLGIFGNDDKAPSPADVDKFKAALKEAGKTDVSILQYDGVGHAFASKAAQKMGMYHEAKAQDAWAKTWAWLDAKLPRK